MLRTNHLRRCAAAPLRRRDTSRILVHKSCPSNPCGKDLRCLFSVIVGGGGVLPARQTSSGHVFGEFGRGLLGYKLLGQLRELVVVSGTLLEEIGQLVWR